jgi:ArsR family transcriptional regulator
MDKNLVTQVALYERQAEICCALGHPIRLRILDLLADRELNGVELLEQLDIPKANLFQHVNVLKGAGLLLARKEGTCQYLSLAYPRIKDACAMVREILNDALARDQKAVLELAKQMKTTGKKAKKGKSS